MTAAPTLVLRFADLGIVTYASLRIVGQPERTVAWVIEEPILLSALAQLDSALPEPVGAEVPADAIDRALRRGPFATQAGELELAYRLGALLLTAQAWALLCECVSDPRAALFVAPSSRLARVPWGILALPAIWPGADELVRARSAAMTTAGRNAAEISWPAVDPNDMSDGTRLIELVDVMLAVPVATTRVARRAVSWAQRADNPPLLVLDPRIPGQLPDSALGSVLGRPSVGTPLSRHFADRVAAGDLLPAVADVVALFRRRDADRGWLAVQLALEPARLLFVGHAAAGTDDAGGSAIYLAEEHPLRATDLTASALPMPPRVALLACASGGDYRFDEARGLAAAMILGGAELVTAVLWSLPTTAGFALFTPPGADAGADPMADLIGAVDDAHDRPDAGRAVNRWQRAQLRRWREGSAEASPVYWAALASFAVNGAR